MNSKEPLLKIEDLVVEAYDVDRGLANVVDRANFRIDEGETLGLIGESASGKTTTAFSILRLIGNARLQTPDPLRRCARGILPHTKIISQREIVGGRILYKGKDLLSLTEKEMEEIRGKEISMIFQNPIPAMNPIQIIGYQVGEPVEAHEKTRREKIREIVYDCLWKVDLADVKKRYRHNPHMFSGGEGQRIMIAMALICGPSLLIADEPTSSLDVIVQKRVLNLIQKLKKEYNLSVLYITHDLPVIFGVSDHVAVMYAGKILEYGNVKTIYQEPRHPYTRGLVRSCLDIRAPRRRVKRIPGEPATPFDRFTGCRFYPRCEYAEDICRKEGPRMIEIEPEHLVSCHRVYEIPDYQV